MQALSAANYERSRDKPKNFVLEYQSTTLAGTIDQLFNPFMTSERRKLNLITQKTLPPKTTKFSPKKSTKKGQK